jgi:hypothetical protein
MVGLGSCVIHPVELPVKFVGRVVFDTPKSECPSTGDGAKMTSGSSPRSKVSFCAVVGDVTRLMSRYCSGAALAFRNYVVVV